MPEADEYQDLGDVWSGRQLVVPDYQRRFAWKQEHVQDLLEDLQYVIDEQERRDDDADPVTHYFGTVVLDEQGQADLPPMAGKTWETTHIVDGQQRLVTTTILIQTIVEVIGAIKPKLGSDEQDIVSESVENYRQNYLEQYGVHKVKINNDSDQELFEEIVYDGDSPEALRRLNDYDVPSQERLLDAKTDIRDWLIVSILIERILDGDDDMIEKYDQLKSGNKSDVIDEDTLEVDGPLKVLNEIDEDEAEELATVLTNIHESLSENFLITEYNVNHSSEAGRIFQSINDRGRDLMMADRIKSYLIYLDNRIEGSDLSERIFNSFANVADTITEYGTEDDIDDYIKSHWRMWSGETRYARTSTYEDTPNEVHRRIKKLKKHAKIDREDEALIEWIESYTKDLKETATAYQKMMYPEEFDADTYGDAYGSEIKRKLIGIHSTSTSENVDTILPAAYRLYAQSPPVLTSEKLYEVVSRLEVMAFRVYSAADRRSNVSRDEYRDLAHRLRWTGDVKSVKKLFSNSDDYTGTTDVSTDDIFEDGDEAMVYTCRRIENKIGNYGYNLLFLDGLRREDIFNGKRTTDNWTGMKKDAIRYFFWEYEHHLRDEPDDIASLEDIADESRDIEHIWAQNRGQDLSGELLSEHEQFVDSLGNLGLLHYSDNRSAKDAAYSEKYEKAYDGDEPDNRSEMHHLKRLPEPGDDEDHPWRGEDIQTRLDKLLEFAKGRWDTKAHAYIPIENEDNLTDEIREDMIEKIRNNFEGYEDTFVSGNIPKVEFGSDIDSDEDEKYEEMNSCSCGSTLTKLNTVDASEDDSSVPCFAVQ